MQLPAHLTFSEPTLMLIADHVHALFFMADGDTLEQLEEMRLEYDQPSDTDEASNANAGSSDRDNHEHHKRFAQMLTDGLAALARDAGVERMHVAAPADLLGLLQAALPGDVKPLIQKTIAHDLTKEDPLEVIERFKETV